LNGKNIIVNHKLIPVSLSADKPPARVDGLLQQLRK